MIVSIDRMLSSCDWRRVGFKVYDYSLISDICIDAILQFIVAIEGLPGEVCHLCGDSCLL
jgi:hypothetical protein